MFEFVSDKANLQAPIDGLHEEEIWRQGYICPGG